MCATTTASSTGTTTAQPCIFGQDQQFSCTLCSAAYKECLDPCQNPTYAMSKTCMP